MTFYIAKHGSDTNPGTEALPFASLGKAQEAGRASGTGYSVSVGPGEYRESLVFRPEDSGSRWTGDGAVLTGGLSIPAPRLSPVPAEIAARLTPEAAP